MESNLIEIEMLDLYETGFIAPCIKIKVFDGKLESEEFYARLDTGSDMTIIPILYTKKLNFPLYNSPLAVRYANGEIDENVISFTGHVIFANDVVLTTRQLVINQHPELGMLGMDILSQTTLFLAPKGGYLLVS